MVTSRTRTGRYEKFKDIVEKVPKPDPTTYEEVFSGIQYLGERVIIIKDKPVLCWEFKYKKYDILCRPIAPTHSKVLGIYYNGGLCSEGLLLDLLRVYLRPIIQEKLTYSLEFDITEGDLNKLEKRSHNPYEDYKYSYEIETNPFDL